MRTIHGRGFMPRRHKAGSLSADALWVHAKTFRALKKRLNDLMGRFWEVRRALRMRRNEYAYYGS